MSLVRPIRVLKADGVVEVLPSSQVVEKVAPADWWLVYLEYHYTLGAHFNAAVIDRPLSGEGTPATTKDAE